MEVSSPLIASPLRFETTYDVAAGELVLMHPGDGRILRTTGATWKLELPDTNPFAQGPSDFFASSWDTENQRIVLFDPVNAKTWIHDGSTWTRLLPSQSPPAQPNLRHDEEDLP